MLKTISFISLSLLMSSSLNALEVSNISGDTRFYYGTADNNNVELFSQESATGQFSLATNVEVKINEEVKVNVGISYLTTLGLENSLVDYVFAGSTAKDQLWVDEINFEATVLEKNHLILGRQYIASPMLYSIDWNIVSNAMDGVYVINEDISKTKLMGFWIGREWSNDYNATADTLNFAGNFRTFGEKGAFGVGAETEMIPTVVAKLWYYNISNISTALWLQAESSFSEVVLGAQYSSRTPRAGDTSSGYALQAKYNTTSFNVSASFSQIAEEGSLSLVNLSGVYGEYSKSPLYTEAWWNWGYVSAVGTTSYALKAEASLYDFYLGTYLTSTTNGSTNIDSTDLTLSANTSVGNLNYMLVYIYIERDDFNNAEGYNTLQGYLTYSF